MPNLDYIIENHLLGATCSLILFIVILINYKHLLYNQAKGGTGYITLFCVMVFYSLFYVKGEVGDIYTSMITYYEYFSGIDTDFLHFEPIYFKLMDLVPYGYVYWRFAVWGSAALILLFVIKKMGCNIYLATIFMCYYCIPRSFYYQRVSLGFALLLLGLYFFLRWKETSNKKSLILSVLLFMFCTLFHRSMPLYIIIMFISIYIPINKRNWLIYLILLPILLYSIDALANAFLSQSEELYDAGINYMDSTARHAERNFNGKLFEFIKWGPYAAITFYALYDYIKHPKQFTLTEKSLLLFGAIMYTASIVLTNKTSDMFLGKMMVQSTFPMTLFLTLYFKNRRHTTACRLFVTAISVSYVFQLIFSGF